MPKKYGETKCHYNVTIWQEMAFLIIKACSLEW